MIEAVAPAFSLPGFFAGTLLWAQLTRWAVLLYVSASKDGGDFLGPPKRRLLWAAPVVALLHPAPWMAGMAVFLAIGAFRAQAASGWAWFFGGLTLAILLMMFVTVAMLVRSRRARE